MRRTAKLLLFVVGLAVIGPATLLGCASFARAADPMPCQRLNAALSEEQRKKAVTWLHQEFPGTDFTIDHSCKVDAKRVAVAVVDFSGLQSALYVLDISGEATQARKLIDGNIESPVVLARPGGALDLFFVQQQPENALMLRSYRTVNLDTGKIDTLFEAAFDVRQRGCAFAAPAGAKRLLVAAAVRFTDTNKDGNPDIVLDREIEDCSSRQATRAEQVFLATPQGWRSRP